MMVAKKFPQLPQGRLWTLEFLYLEFLYLEFGISLFGISNPLIIPYPPAFLRLNFKHIGSVFYGSTAPGTFQ